MSIHVNALDAMPGPLGEGARVVLQAKPAFWTQRGSLMLDAPTRSARSASASCSPRLEHLKRHLAAEGLFDRDRKRPLPFLPRRVGLVCGRASAAERDVVENARRRWPAARFEIRQVAVQGATAVTEVTAALAELDAAPRGRRHRHRPRRRRASRTCCRSATRPWCGRSPRRRTPVVSAIGHDVDTPLLDLVADHRASTPTDAAKAIVPDAVAERAACRPPLASRGRRALAGRLHHERRRLVELRSRPVLTDKGAFVRSQREVVEALRAPGPTAASRASCTAPATTRRTCGPRCARCRRSRRSTGATRSCSRSTARSSATRPTLEVGELLRVRVARGDFAARPVASSD